MKNTILILALIASMIGCSKYSDVKNCLDETMIQRIPKNMELVNVTWKDAQLWTVTRPRKAGETIDTIYFDGFSGFDKDSTYSSRLMLIEQ